MFWSLGLPAFAAHAYEISIGCISSYGSNKESNSSLGKRSIESSIWKLNEKQVYILFYDKSITKCWSETFAKFLREYINMCFILTCIHYGGDLKS